MDKKSEVITIRLSKATKEKLQLIAEEKEWSISKTAEKIITEHLANMQKCI